MKYNIEIQYIIFPFLVVTFITGTAGQVENADSWTGMLSDLLMNIQLLLIPNSESVSEQLLCVDAEEIAMKLTLKIKKSSCSAWVNKTRIESFPRDKFPGLNGLSMELYPNMLYMFGDLFADVNLDR